MSNHSRKAFTVVELLVVIGIIALLIAVLLPVLVKAREQARTAKCASNMRQIYAAILMYTMENRQMLPLPDDFNQAVWAVGLRDLGQLDFSSGTLWPYVSRDVATRQAVYLCPSDGPDRVAGNFFGIPDPQHPRNFTYCFTTELRRWAVDTGSFQSVRWAQIHRPANKILLFEPQTPQTSHIYPMETNSSPPGPPVYTLLARRHLGLGNQCFADGHVELLDPAIFDPKTEAARYYFLLTPAWSHYVDFWSDQ